MVKLLLRPMAPPSRRRIRAQMAWKVPMVASRAASSPISPALRPRISLAALLVEVTATICHGFVPGATRYATRCARTLVLPDPAPARMRSGPLACETASACGGLRRARISSAPMVGGAPGGVGLVGIGPLLL